MPHIISLPAPCAEDWNHMTPDGNSRHCAQCSKTVVDFTAWQPEEVVWYLQTHSGTCGRFRKDQLDVPLPSPEDFVQQVVRTPLSAIKKIAAIFLFVFGLMAGASCRNAGTAPDKVAAAKAAGVPEPAYMGDTTVPPSSIAPVQDPPPAVHPAEPRTLQGEPAIAVPQEALGGAPVLEWVPPRDSARQHPAQGKDSL